jgi:hypothetical protein
MSSKEAHMDGLFSREELLGRPPARRARALLSLIQRRAALAAWRAEQATSPVPEAGLAPVDGSELTEPPDASGLATADAAFLAAHQAVPRGLPSASIHDLERFAAEWAPLAPENPRLLAAIAKLLGEQYRFTYRDVPGVRVALRLDTPAVAEAYRWLFRADLATIYAPRVSAKERAGWALAAFGHWLDALPPFWLVFIYTFALGIPQCLVAIPIAAAIVGPAAGIPLILLGGLLSFVTVPCIAEAAARNGSLRYGLAYLGKLAEEYLGVPGALLFTVANLVLYLLTVMSAAFAISGALANALVVPAWAWNLGLMALSLLLLARGSIQFSLGLSVLLAAVILVLLAFLMALGIPHFDAANLTHGAASLTPGHTPGLGNVVGIVLMGYFAEAFIVQCAKMVLPRDPTGRALIRGGLAGVAAIGLLLCAWTFAVNGEIAPARLAGLTDTVVAAMASRNGAVALFAGTILIVLLPGLAMLRCLVGAFNTAREWLPAPPRSLFTLHEEVDRLVLRARSTRGGASVGLVYAGADHRGACFRVDAQVGGELRHAVIVASAALDLGALFAALPVLRETGLEFTLKVLERQGDTVRVQVASPPGVTCELGRAASGLTLSELVGLVPEERSVVNWLVRRRAGTLEELATGAELDDAATRAALERLEGRGLVRREPAAPVPVYRLRFARRPTRALPDALWQALNVPEPMEPGVRPVLAAKRARTTWTKARAWLQRRLQGERARFVAAVAPIAAVFLIGEALLLAHRASFTGLLGVIGVLANSVFGGVVPLLLLVSSRRKGEVLPGTVLRYLGSGVLLGGIYCFYIALLLLHGLVLWENPLARASAVLTAGLIIAATIAMARQGAFAGRAIVELCDDLRTPGGQRFSVFANGAPCAASVTLEYTDGNRELEAAAGVIDSPAGLRRATFRLSEPRSVELKLWAHQVSPEGNSEALPLIAEVTAGGLRRRVDLGLTGGKAVLPLTASGPVEVRLLVDVVAKA